MYLAIPTIYNQNTALNLPAMQEKNHAAPINQVDRTGLPTTHPGLGEPSGGSGSRRIWSRLFQPRAQSAPPEAFGKAQLSNLSPVQHAASAAPAAENTGSVFDPKTGRIDTQRLAEFVTDLQDALPDPSNTTPTQQAQKAALNATLHNIRTLVAGKDTSEMTDKQLGHLGLQLRDAFADAAKEANALHWSFRPMPWGGDNRSKDVAKQYRLFHKLFVELKRTHLTGAAPFLVKHAAAKAARVAPELARRRAGSAVTHSRSISAEYTPWSLRFLKLVAKFSRDDTSLVDDSSDIDYIGVSGLTAKVKVAGMVEGSAAAIGGRSTNETDDPKQLAAWRMNKQANKWSSLLLHGSASPKARNALHHWQKSVFIAQRALFANQAATPAGMPIYLSNKKQLKGYNNRLDQVAAKLDQLRGGDRLSSLVRGAYPDAATLLQKKGAEVFNPLAVTIPVMPSEERGTSRMPIKIPTAAGTFSMPKVAGEFSDMVGAGVSPFSASASYSSLGFNMELPQPATAMLSTTFRSDMQQPLRLHLQDETLLASGWKPEYAIFHLYRTVSNELSPDADAGSFQPLLKEDRLYYGGEANIAAQFRHTIDRPGAEKLDAIARVCNALQTTYTQFVGHAGKFLNGDKEAFEAINEAVWSKAYPGGLAEARKHPERFIHQSYDAIAKALACAGTHLSIARRQTVKMVERRNLSRTYVEKYKEHILRAENAFIACDKIVKGVHLPTATSALLKDGMRINKGTFLRHNYTAEAEVNGGMDLDLFAPVGSFTVANAAGTASLNVRFQYQNASHQINAGRYGSHLQMEITATTGVMLGSLLPKAVERLAKMIHRIDPKQYKTEDTSSAALHATLRDLIRHTQGTVIHTSDGVTLGVKLRQDPVSGEWNLQQRKVIHTRNSRVNAKVPLVTPAGYGNVGISIENKVQENIFQVLGEDLCMQMYQANSLVELVEKSQASEGEQTSLEDLILKNPIVMEEFFGKTDLIFNIVDKFRLYREEVQRQEPGTSKKASSNEFYRYFEQAPFKRFARHANEARHYAPGATGGIRDPFEPPPSRLYDVQGAGEDILEKWREIKADVAKLKSPAAAVDYYCNDPVGRKVFDAYVRVLTAVRLIAKSGLANIEKSNTGFLTQYRDPKLNKLLAKTLKPIPDTEDDSPIDSMPRLPSFQFERGPYPDLDSDSDSDSEFDCNENGSSGEKYSTPLKHSTSLRTSNSEFDRNENRSSGKKYSTPLKHSTSLGASAKSFFKSHKQP